MLNINFSNPFKTQNIAPFKVNKYNNSIAKYANLAPLACDTVTFTGSKPHEPLNKALMEAFDNQEVCRYVYENAQQANNNLSDFLKKVMKPYMFSESNKNGVVHEIKTRIKSPESIREKVTDKLAHAIKHNTTQTFNPEDAESIKKNCNDIIGGRVILREPTQAKTSALIDSIIKEITDPNIPLEKRLKITKIEHYVPEGVDKKLEYFDADDLERLKDAVNKTFGTNIEVVRNPKTTGYMALHLDVDLSDDDLKAKNNGYIGEIQIVGLDVSLLKDVEDLCYKLKGAKEIKGGHVAYAPFSDYFKKYMENSGNPNIKEDFDTYTRKAYLYQRLREPVDKKQSKKSYVFPTIASCGLKGKIPEELDFNNLARLKTPCDRIYDIFENID